MRNSAETGGCFPTGRHYPGIAHLLRIAAAGLADEWGGETALADLTLVSIDTETTGRDAAVDRIVELACVVWRSGAVVERKSWLFNPGCPIPKEAFDVHGISDADVQDKPSFAEVVPEILAALQGALPLAYNADFDRDFLSAELARVGGLPSKLPPAARRGVRWMDPLVWARELYRDEKGKSLSEMCGRLEIDIGQAHRASDDAEAAMRVMAIFFGDVRVPRTYAGFVQEQQRLGRLFAEERAVWRNRV